MTNFNNKVRKIEILGSTTINHDARIKLNLNCSEYVMIDYLSRIIKKTGKYDDITICYQKTGFDEGEQRILLKSLIQKGFIFPSGDKVQLTSKWNSAFADIENEFNELFWRKDGKVFFTGSKKRSLGFYIKLRKKYSKDFLIEQRDQYARLLEFEHKRGFDRAVMMCERWLNPSNEYYLSDWKGTADEIEKKLNPEKFEKKEKPLTEEDIRIDYENSNQ